MDGLNRFFACRCKFRRAASYFFDFYVGVIKNGHGCLFSSRDPKICWILRMSVWIDLIFCMLTLMQYFLNRQTLHSIVLIFKYQSTAVVFIRSLAVSGSIQWNRVCPSFRPAVWVFSWSLGFCKVWYGARRYVWQSQSF